MPQSDFAKCNYIYANYQLDRSMHCLTKK